MTPENHKKALARPEVVFFDLDNTLYDYDKAHSQAQVAVFNKVQTLLGVDRVTFDEALSDAKTRIKNRLGNTAASHSRLLYFKEAIDLCGLGSQPLISLELEQAYWSKFLAGMVFFENAIDFLEDLRVSGVRMALITDLTAQIQLRKVSYLGLEKYFDVIVTSEEAGAEKPAAAPFVLALERLGEPVKNTWFIGDSPAKDIMGARAHLGAVTFQRVDANNPAGTAELSPDYEFENFDSLRRIFENAVSV